MKASELWKERKEHLIPSVTVRTRLEEIGWEPSDFELAVLIHNTKHASLAEEWEALRGLDAKDAALTAQIEGYIQDRERMIRNVMEYGQGSFVYELRVKSWSKPTGAGYYRRGEQALAVGLKFKKPFSISKYVVFQGEGDGAPDFAPYVPADTQLTPDLIGSAQQVGWVRYGEDGAIADAWSAPSPCYGKEHFTRASVAIPTPFQMGDVVYVEREGVTRSYREYGVVTPARKGAQEWLMGRDGGPLSWEKIDQWGNLSWAYAEPRFLELAKPGDMEQTTWNYLRQARELLLGEGSFEQFLQARWCYRVGHGLALPAMPDHSRSGLDMDL